MITLNSFFKIFISSHLLILQVSAAATGGQARVVGGVPTTINKAAYIVQLHKDGHFVCGGALVTPTKVLTAAHCVHGKLAQSFVVVGGATKLTDPGVQVGVSKIYVPPAYNQNNYNSDVAVLKLATPLTGESIETINISTRSVKHGDPVQLFGWGTRMDYTDYTSTDLHTAYVNVIDTNWCKQVFGRTASLTNTMFCAGASGKSSCYGDSGSPVLVNGELSGVVSWGIECGRTNLPAVYTQLSEVMPFLRTAMQQ